ncbi:MAG: class B sortase [Gemmiger sp.]|nr:class B sortase [Gemmiger sp.]
MHKKKRYRHLDGSTAYYPFAARTGMRRRQRRRATLLRVAGVAALALAAALIIRQTLLHDGQPPAPTLTVTATAVATRETATLPVAVAVKLATATGATPAATPETAPTVLEPLRILLDQNGDLVGWLTVEGTNIDYPVLQTPHDNTYYLRRGFDKLYALSGSLFLDANCRITSPATTNWVIYGHNMGSGSMFGTLARYASEDFYAQHPTFVFSTLYHTSRWQVLAAVRTTLGADELPYYTFFDAQNKAEWQSRYQAVMDLALYDTGQTAAYGDQLLTLSTCGTSNSFTDTRFAVLAKRLD